MLGLAFKAGTSDARKSPGVNLANLLSKKGSEVNAFDPQANEEAEEDLRKAINIYKSVEEAVSGTDAIFISTEWPEFKTLDWHQLSKMMRGNLVVDCMNLLDSKSIEDAGLKYIGVGRH